MPAGGLHKKVFQPCDGGRRRRTIYLPTVDSATSIPSINNSPWIRGAPHSGFSRFMRRISAQISDDPWTTAHAAGLPVPVGAETAPVPTDHGLRLDDDNRVLQRRVQSI